MATPGATTLKALWKDFGKPAVDYVLTYIPEGTEDQLRKALTSFQKHGGEIPATPPAPRPRQPAQRPSGRASDTLAVTGAPAIVRNVSGANRRAVAGAKYDVDALATRYPETLPPVVTFDPDKGKFYPKKQRSSEQDALAVARRDAQAAMDTEGYTRVFDVAKRDYVNKSDYPIVGSTLSNVPGMPSSLAVHTARANEPEGLARFGRAVSSMIGNPGAEHWYAVAQLEQAFIDKYGLDLGRAMFRRRFAEAMGATTGGMSPKSNYLMAQLGNFMDVKGLPLPTAKGGLPYPVGGPFLSSNIDTFNEAVHGRQGLTIAQPKRFNFTGSFLGHLDRPPLDTQISDEIWPDLGGAPRDYAYGVYEQPIHDLAKLFYRPATRVQDVGWAGIKKAKEPGWNPQSMMGDINDTIERTARVTGKDPDEVLDMSILAAQRPTYAVGGAVRRSYAVGGI